MLGFSGAREWVYHQSIGGRFQKYHRISGSILQALLFVTPWIMVGGHPAVRIDLPGRRMFVLGSTFTASDTVLLWLVLLFSAFSLFFFTSLFGRLWCGYACPQTVFLEEWIRPLERLVEGDRWKRISVDKKGFSVPTTVRKGFKFGLFLAVAFVISMSFQSFFAGAHALWTGQAGAVDYTLVTAFTAGWFVDFAWFREQACNYVCPYARFQSVLCDDESLIVTYDAGRGEPRGKDAKSRGGCVDCNKCVYVCPQGIDIRQGFQLECIACGRCIDACDEVMEKLGYAGLVRYSTIAAEEGRKTRYLRPRTVVYAGLLTAISAAFVFLLASHNPIDASVNHMTGALYEVDADGFVRNTFMLKVTNNDPSTPSRDYEVAIEGVTGAEITLPPLALGPTESRTVPLVVRVPASELHGRTVPIEVKVKSGPDEVTLDTTFKGPES